MLKAFELENKLKNVAIREIVRIRERNEKRSLKEAVKTILAKQREKDAKIRRKLKKKLIREYEFNGAEFLEEKDFLFNRVIVGMDRLLKVLTSHSAAVDSLEKKLNIISAAKKKPGAEIDGKEFSEQKPLLSIPEDKMFNTGELEGFEAYEDEDNLDFIEKSDLDRDQFMEELKAGYEPNENILADYRIPVQVQKRLLINSENESLADITSEESSDD